MLRTLRIENFCCFHHQKVLLVEGKQDVRVIPELIEANGVNWGTRKSPVVYIRDYEGYQNLVDPERVGL